MVYVLTLPSIDKGKHGFDGQKCAHTASSPLVIQQVSPAGLFLSGHISAPTKLLTPVSDVFSIDFWLLRRSWAESAYSRRCCRATFLWSEAGASQGEKGKKRRKDTLAGVFALVNRWYEKHPLGEAAASRSGRWMAVCVRRRGSPGRSRRGRPAGRCPRLRPGACPQDPRSRARYTGRGSAPSCPGRPGRR